MTIPYLPGWGDILKQNLPQIAGALDPIINPNRASELALKEAIMKNPELVGHLATLNKDNPGALQGVFGPNTQGFIDSLQETPTAQLERTKTQAAAGVAANRPEDVGAAGLGIENPTQKKQRELDIQQGQLRFDQDRKSADFFNSLPDELRNDAYFKQSFGTSKVEYQKIQTLATRMKAAEPWRGQSNKEIYQAYKGGKIDSEALQGLWDVNPDAMKMLFRDMESDDANAVRMAVAKDARKNGRLDIMSQLFISTAKNALENELNVKPGALFEAQYGYPADEVVPGLSATYTSEDVSAAKTAMERQRMQTRSRVLAPLNAALKELNKTKSTGGAAAVTAAAQQAGIPLAVVYDTSPLFRNKVRYYYMNPDGTKEEIDSDTVSTMVSTGKIPVPGTEPTPAATEERENAAAAQKAADTPALDDDQRELIAMYQGNPAGLVKDEDFRALDPEGQQQVLSQFGTARTGKTTKSPDYTATAFSTNLADQLVDFAVNKNMTKEQVESFKSYQKLSQKDRDSVLKSLRF